jgi:hypothetical protein
MEYAASLFNPRNVLVPSSLRPGRVSGLTPAGPWPAAGGSYEPGHEARRPCAISTRSAISNVPPVSNSVGRQVGFRRR